jgi:ribosome-associated heat shock protein Hsp15
MTGTRIDKWLWAARFFKTRALAIKACDLGRVSSNGQPAKPAREVRLGDSLQITNDSGIFTVDVLVLSETRAAASIAQTLYRETEESRAMRARVQEDRRLNPGLFEPAPRTRPSKRDRRLIHSFRGH